MEPIYVENAGEVSDGYHTFNELYHQRAVLFATIVNSHLDISWKSLRHEDGSYGFNSDGKWFIVGIDTPEGPYTYHYETDKYWDMFKCVTLDYGKTLGWSYRKRCNSFIKFKSGNGLVVYFAFF